MTKQGITPMRAAEFLDHLAADHDGEIPPYVIADVAPHLIAMAQTREAAVLGAWSLRSDEIAAALRKHGYDAWAADQVVADRIADLAEIEPTPGYDDRAMDRARREGALPPISDAELNRGGLLELRCELARVLAVDPDLPLAELAHAVRTAVIERREARDWCERHKPLLEQALQQPTA